MFSSQPFIIFSVIIFVFMFEVEVFGFVRIIIFKIQVLFLRKKILMIKKIITPKLTRLIPVKKEAIISANIIKSNFIIFLLRSLWVMRIIHLLLKKAHRL